MKLAAILVFTTFMFFAHFGFGGSVLHAENNAESEEVFVDLDGDGFNDNIPDEDNNSIPDKAEDDKYSDQAEGSELMASAEFKPIESLGDFDPSSLLSNSELFGQLKFVTRAQSCFRGGFEAGSDFGPGNGIGLGAVSGCAGGVCY
ncbi:MAG: hypothetical protein GWN61_00280 [candidate division Zixibacteria bacterium]|nr:hypothetical protein [candidate division Zixibacteria bacterium]NIR62246.1 hypothetical protein [candidate division Zixibacteria bacterium]NIS14797.1 hypothetical protein [candidate division Zixibacteria bacterium]NIS44481.1 hypothetical protein [candidate division Zixibacteria bacterium]NIU12496.1 hypothetical protein [candidate division Zixibacteria bacterium]